MAITTWLPWAQSAVFLFVDKSTDFYGATAVASSEAPSGNFSPSSAIGNDLGYPWQSGTLAGAPGGVEVTITVTFPEPHDVDLVLAIGHDILVPMECRLRTVPGGAVVAQTGFQDPLIAAGTPGVMTGPTLAQQQFRRRLRTPFRPVGVTTGIEEVEIAIRVDGTDGYPLSLMANDFANIGHLAAGLAAVPDTGIKNGWSITIKDLDVVHQARGHAFGRRVGHQLVATATRAAMKQAEAFSQGAGLPWSRQARSLDPVWIYTQADRPEDFDSTSVWGIQEKPAGATLEHFKSVRQSLKIVEII